MFTQRVWRIISANSVRWRRAWWCEIRLRSAPGEASMLHLWKRKKNSSKCFHSFFHFFLTAFISLHRGFGFVTFADQAGVDKVLAQTRHELDSKTVSVHLHTLLILPALSTVRGLRYEYHFINITSQLLEMFSCFMTHNKSIFWWTEVRKQDFGWFYLSI